MSLVLTGDQRIRELNRNFLEIDRPTDVLAFPLADPESLGDSERAVFLGEIYISVETARAQAAAAKTPYPREVARLAVHGLLHLLGYDHETRAERRGMAGQEERLLRALRPTIAGLGKPGG